MNLSVLLLREYCREQNVINAVTICEAELRSRVDLDDGNDKVLMQYFFPDGEQGEYVDEIFDFWELFLIICDEKWKKEKGDFQIFNVILWVDLHYHKIRNDFLKNNLDEKVIHNSETLCKAISEIEFKKKLKLYEPYRGRWKVTMEFPLFDYDDSESYYFNKIQNALMSSMLNKGLAVIISGKMGSQNICGFHMEDETWFKSSNEDIEAIHSKILKKNILAQNRGYLRGL